MINILATMPRGNAKRLYKMEINGFQFLFEIENNEQAGKEPIQILYDELKVISALIEKSLEIVPEMKELPQGEQKITLEDILKPEEPKL